MWSSLFPPTCLGCGRLLRHDRALALCTRCRPEQGRLAPDLALGSQICARWAYDGPLSRAVLQLKFSAALALAGPLGRLLASDPWFYADERGEAWELVMAVPLHWRRRVARGFDQSELLLRWALRHAPIPPSGPPPRPLYRGLVRTRSTSPQSELPARRRLGNVEQAFAVRHPGQVRGRRVLVIDDVTTTGATLQACIQTLNAAGAESVGGLALLRTLNLP